MKWQTKIVDKTKWHKMFAWVPFCKDDPENSTKTWTWLEPIFRRVSNSNRYGNPTWEYAIDEFEILKYTELDAKEEAWNTAVSSTKIAGSNGGSLV